MNELEKYIRDHATEFDAAMPAEGHEERFLARLAVTQLPQEAPAKRAGGFRKVFRAAWIPALVCAAVAAAFADCPVRITGAQAVEKSYPGFFRDFINLGGNAHVERIGR